MFFLRTRMVLCLKVVLCLPGFFVFLLSCKEETTVTSADVSIGEATPQITESTVEPSLSITITSHEEGEEINEWNPEISGVVTTPDGDLLDSYDNLRVSIKRHGGDIASDGSFTVIPLILPGRAHLTLEVYNRETDDILAGKTIMLFLKPDNEVGEYINSAGGRVDMTDPRSPVYGAGIVVPPGAFDWKTPEGADKEVYFRISYALAHMAWVPPRYTQLGEPVEFYPAAARFTEPLTAVMPYDPALVPDGATADDIFVLGLCEDEDSGYDSTHWVEMPATPGQGNTVELPMEAFVCGPFVTVVNTPLQQGELLIETEPMFAAIMVDSHNTRTETPEIIRDLTPGEHLVKLYRPGYNEIFETVMVEEGPGKILSFEMTRPEGTLPDIEFLTDFSTGQSVSGVVFSVEGQVFLEGVPLTGQRMVFFHNGRERIFRGGFCSGPGKKPASGPCQRSRWPDVCHGCHHGDPDAAGSTIRYRQQRVCPVCCCGIT